MFMHFVNMVHAHSEVLPSEYDVEKEREDNEQQGTEGRERGDAR